MKPTDGAGTREVVERWKKDVRDYETKFAKAPDEDVKIGVILDLAPPSVQQRLHLNANELKTYAQVRRLVLDYVEAEGDQGFEVGDGGGAAGR